MSWVLILTPRRQGDRPLFPAVIGGYPTKEQAEAAGVIATGEDVPESDPDYFYKYHMVFDGYVVIPGAADTLPEPVA